MKKKALWSYFMHTLQSEVWMRLEFVCTLCISYEWNAKKSMTMKRNNLMCTSYDWCFMYSLNGMLNSYVYEKESSCA